ncbi:MAG: hypothetical protein APR55_06665 [Methanolinea sp. SDB]|nr:MAG: hypothetical protein APR55_06665 [Methanolinea sp. SDB]
MAKTVFSDTPPQGTIVTAAFLNAVNRHRHTGRDNDGEGALDFAVDTGTSNAYVVALSPALDAVITGMPIYFKAANPNTGASTLNVNSLGAKALRKNGVDALAAGDIQAGQIVLVIYDGTYFQIIGLSAGHTGDIRMSLSSTPKTGEIKLNGAELSRSAYSRLWVWAQANSVVVPEADWQTAYWGAFSSGDGSTTFRVPDFRGEFFRGFDDGRGVDAGRVFGEWQADELKAHSHVISPSVTSDSGSSADGPDNNGDGANISATQETGGVETRPRNITVYVFIKY